MDERSVLMRVSNLLKVGNPSLSRFFHRLGDDIPFFNILVLDTFPYADSFKVSCAF